MFIDSKYLSALDNLLFKISLGLEAPYYPTIAGGAIRDMLLDTEVADIDVFIDAPEINLISLKAWFKEVEVCEHGLYEDSSFNVLYKITDDPFPVPIQIIQVKSSVQEHISKFPLSLSRVSYTRKEGLQGITPPFISQSHNCRLYFDKPVNYQYLDKMKQKFPDWGVSFAKPEYNPAKLEF